MLLLVSGGRFGKRRPRRPQDDVPVRPMLDLLAFWTLLCFGAFALVLAVAGAIAWRILDSAADLPLASAALVFAGVAAICLNRAIGYWWRFRSG